MSYSFLLEMGWKSALIAGLALALMLLLRSRSAADRAAVLRLGVVMLLILPLVSLTFPALVVETPAPVAPAAAPVVVEPASFIGDAEIGSAETITEPMSDWNDPSIIFLMLYAGGLLMVGGRLAAGLWTLRRWTARAQEVTSPQWLDALRREAGDRDIRLLVSEDAASPMSWGWRRPVILLDLDTLAETDDAEAIIAHEVAHIARRDWLSLIASRVTVALFWFNPLVWLLDREVAQQAEEAADSRAAMRIEPARYAQTLLDWARLGGGPTPLPANAMAGTEPGLVRRVKAILDGRIARRSGSFWTFAAMAACAAFAAPVAALEFIPEAPEAPRAPEAPEAPAAPLALAALAVAAPPAPAAPDVPLAAVPPAPPTAHGMPHSPMPPASLVMARPAAIAAAAMASAEARRRGEWIDADKLQAEIEAAVAEASRSAEIHAAAAREAARHAHRAAREGVARGAEGMMRGADGMERGARNMDAEARKLRGSRAYREEQIAKAARRGEHLTHEELLEAADEMEDGAREMRDAAREMREGAREMRPEARENG